jgi:hypothetical protein
VHSKFLQALGVRRLARQLSASHPSTSLQLVAVQPGFVPTTGLGRQASLFARAGMYAMSYLPLPFLESEEKAGETLCNALVKPLEAFERDPTAPQAAQAGVSETWLVKGGKVARPDERTGDEALQDKWWPAELADE